MTTEEILIELLDIFSQPPKPDSDGNYSSYGILQQQRQQVKNLRLRCLQQDRDKIATAEKEYHAKQAKRRYSVRLRIYCCNHCGLWHLTKSF